MTTFSPDRLASQCAGIVQRFRSVHAGAQRDLDEVKARRAALKRPAKIDAAAGALAVAKAQAADAVHGTTSALVLAVEHQQGLDAHDQAVAAFDREAAALDQEIADRTVALAGAASAVADVTASSRAATARAAGLALGEARAQYRAAVLTVFGVAQQILALETLAQLGTWPENSAFRVRGESIELPGIGAFNGHTPDEARAIGVQVDPGPAGRVRMSSDQAQQHALALFHSIRAQLEAAPAQAQEA